jgi:threonyl-tRNA synthetase
MKNILDHMGLDYTHGFGEAAFYGPKLDIQIRNVFGKEDTLITIQIDFQLAERFEMFYTDRDGSRRHPIIIHRTSIGCYERTLALLIEKYAGALPLWMAPEQARILPISERHLEEAAKWPTSCARPDYASRSMTATRRLARRSAKAKWTSCSTCSSWATRKWSRGPYRYVRVWTAISGLCRSTA